MMVPGSAKSVWTGGVRIVVVLAISVVPLTIDRPATKDSFPTDGVSGSDGNTSISTAALMDKSLFWIGLK